MDDGIKFLETKLGFDRVRAMICDRCQSEAAKTLALEEEISSEEPEIRRRLLLTDEMRLILMFEDNFPTGGYVDSTAILLLLRQKDSSLDSASVMKLRIMLDTLSKVLFFFGKAQPGLYPNLAGMSSQFTSFPLISHRIDSIIDKYGEVKDGASPEIARIRHSLSDKQALVSKKAAEVLARARQAGIIDSDASVTVRDSRLLIPVPAASKRQLGGFVYDESASGKTVFIEPAEVVELSNEIRDLKFAERREVVRILFELSEFIRPYLADLLDASEYLSTIDFILAKAGVALDMIAGMPVISTDGRAVLRKARHPLLEKILRREGREIVPLDITLSPTKRILLVSGPNAGGKSVCLKTFGLLQYMFQWGMLIPTSETSEMVIFEKIMVDIGDDQNLDDDLSTYSSFLHNMKNVLAEASPRTLVLLDEFGSGTEPSAGGAIAEAMLAALEKAGTYGVITTHYTNLKMYASKPDSAVINGAMTFDAKRIAPLFKLETGLPGNSFAFELARKTGLPEEIVKDAEERAGEEFVDMERSLRRIAHSRKNLDEKLERVRKADRTLEEITEKYRKELAELKNRKRQIIEEARQQALAIVGNANREVENTIRVIRESQAEKVRTAEVRKDLQALLASLTDDRKTAEDTDYVERKLRQLEQRQARSEERRGRQDSRKKAVSPIPAAESRKLPDDGSPLKVGDKVRVKSNGMVGEIAKAGGRRLLLHIGGLTMETAESGVERISANEYREAVKESAPATRSAVVTGASINERKLNFHPELDIRGERLSEAMETVTRYVDDAIMLGVPQIRIIHGKGTGVLHEEIQKYLRTVPGVDSVTDEHILYGGSGVTIVTFG